MNKIHTITLLALLLTFAACETTVDIPLPPHEKRIVVNSLLEADKEIEVYVSRSYAPTEVLNAEEIMLPDATVELLQNNVVISTLAYIDTAIQDWFGAEGDSIRLGKFVAEGIIAQVGETYTLRISHPDFPTATATATTPPNVRFITGEFIKEAGRKVYEDGYTEIQSLFRMTIKDTVLFDNFYKLENLSFTTTDFFGGGEDSVLIEIWNINGEAELAVDGSFESNSNFVSDETFNGQEKTIDFLITMPMFSAGNDLITDYDIFGFEGTISTSFKPYKNYIEKIDLQRNSQGGIDFLPSEPVVVDSNVENGYGFFGGSTQTRFSVVF